MLAGAALLSFFAGPVIKRDEGKLKIAATIFPLYDIAKNIAGERAKVVLILPPGASPHTFELTPAKAREINDVDLIFKVGVVDDWIDGVVNIAPEAKLLTVNAGVTLKKSEEEDEAYDPHYWLRPQNGIIIAGNIYRALAATDPSNEDYYRSNFENFVRAVEVVDQELRNRFSNLSKRELIVFHNAWQYFAEEYDLRIVAVFQPSAGKEPTPAHLRNIFEMVAKRGIKVIFIEPQFSPDLLRPIANDLGLRVFVLDPLGGLAESDSYLNLLRYNSRIISEALK